MMLFADLSFLIGWEMTGGLLAGMGSGSKNFGSMVVGLFDVVRVKGHSAKKVLNKWEGIASHTVKDVEHLAQGFTDQMAHQAGGVVGSVVTAGASQIHELEKNAQAHMAAQQLQLARNKKQATKSLSHLKALAMLLDESDEVVGSPVFQHNDNAEDQAAKTLLADAIRSTRRLLSLNSLDEEEQESLEEPSFEDKLKSRDPDEEYRSPNSFADEGENDEDEETQESEPEEESAEPDQEPEEENLQFFEFQAEPEEQPQEKPNMDYFSMAESSESGSDHAAPKIPHLPHDVKAAAIHAGANVHNAADAKKKAVKHVHAPLVHEAVNIHSSADAKAAALKHIQDAPISHREKEAIRKAVNIRDPKAAKAAAMKVLRDPRVPKSVKRAILAAAKLHDAADAKKAALKELKHLHVAHVDEVAHIHGIADAKAAALKRIKDLPISHKEKEAIRMAANIKDPKAAKAAAMNLLGDKHVPASVRAAIHMAANVKNPAEAKKAALKELDKLHVSGDAKDAIHGLSNLHNPEDAKKLALKNLNKLSKVPGVSHVMKPEEFKNVAAEISKGKVPVKTLKKISQRALSKIPGVGPVLKDLPLPTSGSPKDIIKFIERLIKMAMKQLKGSKNIVHEILHVVKQAEPEVKKVAGYIDMGVNFTAQAIEMVITMISKLENNTRGVMSHKMSKYMNKGFNSTNLFRFFKNKTTGAVDFTQFQHRIVQYRAKKQASSFSGAGAGKITVVNGPAQTIARAFQAAPPKLSSVLPKHKHKNNKVHTVEVSQPHKNPVFMMDDTVGASDRVEVAREQDDEALAVNSHDADELFLQSSTALAKSEKDENLSEQIERCLLHTKHQQQRKEVRKSLEGEDGGLDRAKYHVSAVWSRVYKCFEPMMMPEGKETDGVQFVHSFSAVTGHVRYALLQLANFKYLLENPNTKLAEATLLLPDPHRTVREQANRIWKGLSVPSPAVAKKKKAHLAKPHHLIPRLKEHVRKASKAAKRKRGGHGHKHGHHHRHAHHHHEAFDEEDEFTEMDFKAVNKSVVDACDVLSHDASNDLAYKMQTLAMLLRFRYCEIKFSPSSGMDPAAFSKLLEVSGSMVPDLYQAAAKGQVDKMAKTLKSSSFLHATKTRSAKTARKVEHAVKVQAEAIKAQLKKGIKFLEDLHIRNRVDQILSFFHMIENFLQLIDKDQGASMDDVANVLVGFVKEGAGQKGSAHKAFAKLRHHLAKKISKAKKEAKEQIKKDNKDMDAHNEEAAAALHKAGKHAKIPDLNFLEHFLADEEDVNPKALGQAAAQQTTAGIQSGIAYATHEINKTSSAGKQSKVMKLLSNPHNLAKVISFLEGTFDKLLNELQVILSGDFVESLAEMLHMQMEVHVYAESARDIFMASRTEIDFIFAIIFLSIFSATVYGLFVAMAASGYLFGWCKCCASCCINPDGYLEEDSYKPEGPCLSMCPSLKPVYEYDCFCPCQPRDNADRCTRGCFSCLRRTRDFFRGWCCDLRNAYTCASVWINCNFCLLLIPLSIAIGMIVAAFVLWYGSCYGIEAMTEAICKMLKQYSTQLGVDPTSIAVCNGQGPCSAATNGLPIAAGLVGAGTVVMFLCQYSLLNSLWGHYYWSKRHHADLKDIDMELANKARVHRNRWMAAHPEEAKKLMEDADSMKSASDEEDDKGF